MTKPAITIEDIIAYHEWRAKDFVLAAEDCRACRNERTASRHDLRAAAHREAAALLRKEADNG